MNSGRFDRAAVVSLPVLLSVEGFLVPRVGGLAALVATIMPLVAVAYWSAFVRYALSPDFRREAREWSAAIAPRRTTAALLGVFCFLFVVSLGRGALAGSVDPLRAMVDVARWTAVFALIWALAVRAHATRDPGGVIVPVATGLLLHAGLNVLLLAAGQRNDLLLAGLIRDPEPALLLGLIGLDRFREVLPLANGTGGIQMAAGMPLGFAMMRYRLTTSRRSIALFVLSLTCVLLTDSRGGLLGGVVGIGVALLPFAMRRHAKWTSVAVFVLPIVFLLAVRLLSAEGAAADVSRAGEGSVGPLSGRPIIWGTILLFLSAFSMMHLVGYGAFGQIASGVNAKYAFLFSTSYAATTTAGAHNTLLQLVLDMGYLGLFVYLALAWRLISEAAEDERNLGEGGAWGALAAVCIVCLLFLGVTDATMTGYNTNTLLLFIAVALHVVTAPYAPRQSHE